MNFSSCYYHDKPRAITNYSSLLGDTGVFAATHEDCPPLSEAASYPHPVLDFDYTFQEGFFYDFVTQPYQNIEAYSSERVQEIEQPLFTNCNPFCSEYDSCFNFSGCCPDDVLSYNINMDYTSGLENSEDWFQTEEHTQNQLSCEENPWSDYLSWFSFVNEEDGTDYCKQEPVYTFSIDDLGICEGIFGYWPCMMQKHQEALVL